ncbi:MAG: serine/threonine-protein kinase [Thermoanaerobaculia bacterium]|nr:serine/threonine-protein kinase [Thermoanaerobaculia bacterium]
MTTLGRYELYSLLGKGGMGEVYIARDTALGRKVAIKILPRARTRDESLKARFVREARAIASLNHPNIVTIHEVSFTQEGEAGFPAGVPYLVMELVSGEPLQSILQRTSLPLDRCLDIAVQALEGLATAHQNSVIHRDVKPSNLVVTAEGRVKILDFGLSKLLAEDRATSRQGALTEESTIPGTIDYLSPEQALGDSVDGRSDIFSFGIVFYEMLTGLHPFEAPSSTGMLARILTQPARSWDDHPDVPEVLRHIVDRCLEKDVEKRFQSAREVLRELEHARAFLSSGSDPILPPQPPPLGQSRPRWTLPRFIDRVKPALPGIGAGLVLMAAIAIFVWRPAEKPAQTFTPLRPVQLTSSPRLDIFPALSPDASSVAYASDRGNGFEVFVRSIASGGREIPITSGGGQCLQASWSPDGNWIAYVSRDAGGIWIVPSLGGKPRRITEFGSRPAWSPDGQDLVFQSEGITDLSAGAFPAGPPSSIWKVDFNGSRTTQLTRPGAPPGGHGSPVFSPDGKWVLFVTYVRPRSELWLVPAAGGEPVVFAREQPFYFDPVFAPDSTYVYFASAQPNSPTGVGVGLWRQPLKKPQLQPAGPPVELLNLGLATVRHIAVARDGKRIFFSALTTSSNLFSVTRPGAPPMQVTVGTGRCSRPAFSPDGKQLAYSYWRSGVNNDIWVLKSDGGDPVQLTTDPGNDDYPSWFPDGEKIAFLTTRTGHVTVWAGGIQGFQQKLIADLGTQIDAARLSPDGAWLVYNSRQAGGITNLWVARSDGTDARQLTFDQELAGFPCWSPDGSRIGLEIRRGDDFHAAVIPREGGPIKQVTNRPGIAWPYTFSPDGKKLVFAGYREGYWNLYTADIETGKEEAWTTYRHLNGYVRYPALSPKNDRIVYEYAETTGNIWMVEFP